ncbi:hypothetical protein E3J74_01540 [Candidatus Bathyarchaeota archaeon]|nr:MAG: hypothetical protein E3J74_01540 [Candidatus Bathyarchaeota archaeon]
MIAFGSQLPRLYESPYTIQGVGSVSESDRKWLDDWWIYESPHSTEVERYYSLEPEQVGYLSVDGIQLSINSTVKVMVVMGTPYFSALIHQDVALVYPQTYGYFESTNPFSETIPQTTHDRIPLLQTYYTRTASPWTLHIPFTINVEKMGESSFTVNKQIEFYGLRGTELVEISNPSDADEKVKVTFNVITSLTDLGDTLFSEVGGEWFSSDISSDLLYDACPTSFSNYWFGASTPPIVNNLLPKAWFEDAEIVRTVRHINGRTRPMPLVLTNDSRIIPLDPDSVKGWVGSLSQSGIFREVDYDPISASINDVVEYLKLRHTVVNPNLYGVGISISGDRMRIFVPRDEMSWSFKLEISSEITDTYVK